VVPVNRSEIEAALQPYILRRFQPGDEAWAHQVKVLRKGGPARVWWARLRGLIGRSVKNVAQVTHDYSGVWSQDQMPGAPGIENSRYFLRWGEQGFEVRGWAEKRIHLLLFSNILRSILPSTVLEVGSGNGLILMMLALGHPSVRFTGIELTDAGVQAARRLQAHTKLPEAILASLPFEVADPDAFRRVEFRQGNAAGLPFPDAGFDLAMTSLALEQMNEVKDSAFRELARVARRKVVMLEPFRDFNRTPERRYYTQSRNYLSSGVSDLPKYGLRPVVIFEDFPSKVNRGVGLIVADTLAHSAA
jgi:ubiquinone/menaquinone biosynthesis C-methylase UbiE